MSHQVLMKILATTALTLSCLFSSQVANAQTKGKHRCDSEEFSFRRKMIELEDWSAYYQKVEYTVGVVGTFGKCNPYSQPIISIGFNKSYGPGTSSTPTSASLKLNDESPEHITLYKASASYLSYLNKFDVTWTELNQYEKVGDKLKQKIVINDKQREVDTLGSLANLQSRIYPLLERIPNIFVIQEPRLEQLRSNLFRCYLIELGAKVLEKHMAEKDIELCKIAEQRVRDFIDFRDSNFGTGKTRDLADFFSEQK